MHSSFGGDKHIYIDWCPLLHVSMYVWVCIYVWVCMYGSKGLKVNLGKTKVVVCGSITKDGMSKSKVDPC